MGTLLGFYLLLVGAWYDIPETVEPPDNLIGWKSAQSLTLGLGFQGISDWHYDFGADFFEFSLVELGRDLSRLSAWAFGGGYGPVILPTASLLRP